MKDDQQFRIKIDIKKTCLLVLIACLVAYTSCQEPEPDPDRIPENCSADPDVWFRFCCVFPPFFTMEIAKECGGIFNIISVDTESNVTEMHRSTGLDRCGYWVCILDKYAFLSDNGLLDDEKFLAHLDIWVSLNPAFTDVMVEAKRHCALTIRFYKPVNPCDFPIVLHCFRNYINVKCPVTLQTPDCEVKKAFFEKCGNYFV